MMDFLTNNVFGVFKDLAAEAEAKTFPQEIRS